MPITWAQGHLSQLSNCAIPKTQQQEGIKMERTLPVLSFLSLSPFLLIISFFFLQLKYRRRLPPLLILPWFELRSGSYTYSVFKETKRRLSFAGREMRNQLFISALLPRPRSFDFATKLKHNVSSQEIRLKLEIKPYLW